MNLLRVQQKLKEDRTNRVTTATKQKKRETIEQPEALISGHIPKKKVAVKEYYPLAIHSL